MANRGFFDVRADVTFITRQLGIAEKQIPFLTAYALTKTAQDIKDAEYKLIGQVFDRPTRFTLNSLFVRPATKSNLVASVEFKEGFGSVPAWRYLGPHVDGGGRQKKSHASADWKELNISTPTIKGACYIDAEYEAGDQRLWHVKCPGCDDGEFAFQFGKNFVYTEKFPYNAHYVAPCCGTVIEASQKNDLVRKGRWIATKSEPGRHRSYHFDALSSPFVPWDLIAERKVLAGDDPSRHKTFDNLTLGIAHEVRGDAPDFARLMERREGYEPGRIPAAGLMLVCGADVQHTGIWFEVVAFGSDKQSWSVEHGFVDGDTTDPERGAFLDLVKVYDRHYPDAFGATRQIDALAIDAGDGGRANQVYSWTRGRHRARAIKGQPGWTTPAIGTPTKVSINLKGKKITSGAMLWPVGTWTLKATYYANLRKDGRKAGAEIDPPGYCHHHLACDEQYFRQQTAEYLKTVTLRGRQSRVWQETGPNHLLDARVYAMAMADYLGMNRMTPDDWSKLSKDRGVPLVLQQPDLMAPESVKIAADVRPTLLAKKSQRGRRVLSRGIS